MSMPNDKFITVATPNNDIVAYRPKLQMVKDLMGGQDAMRAAGSRYLRQFPGEPEKKWAARVKGATLLNVYERTLAYLGGQVFAKDIHVVGDGATEQDAALGPFAELVENADGEGNNLTVWAKRFFHASINDGFGLILIDSPHVESRRGEGGGREFLAGMDEFGQEQWEPLHAGNAEAIGLRPRFIHVWAENVLGWRFELRGGTKKLTLLRLLETYKELGEWDAGDVIKEQVRVLRPGRFEVWRRADNDKDAWSIFDEGVLLGDEIPVVFFRPGKPLGDVTCCPALESLAQKNIEHWQKQAEHNQMMVWVRSPGTALIGADATIGSDGMEQPIPVGPGVVTRVPTGGDIKSFGVDPSSVTASREELEDLQRQMALFGLQLLMPRTGDVTATEKAINSGENDSTLKGWAMEFKDALEQAFVFAAVFMGGGIKAPSVEINTEFRPAIIGDDTALTVLEDTWKNGGLSKRTWWRELQRRGALADDFDHAEEEAKIEADTRQQAGPSLDAASLADRMLAAGGTTPAGQNLGQAA